jgi:threonine/homoserine/homoserine lactone efflux protein
MDTEDMILVALMVASIFEAALLHNDISFAGIGLTAYTGYRLWNKSKKGKTSPP